MDELLIVNDERNGWQTEEGDSRPAGKTLNNVTGLQVNRLGRAQLGACLAESMGVVAEDGTYVEVGKGEDVRSVEEVECRNQGDDDAQ